VPAPEERVASAPAPARVPAVAVVPAVEAVAPQPPSVRERPRSRRALFVAAPARAASPTHNAVGTLAIQASPWAELTIDGAREGLTPVYRRIAAGTHRIVLVHPPTGRRATRSVRVAEGAVTRLTVELQ
jgi:PEGA domain